MAATLVEPEVTTPPATTKPEPEPLQSNEVEALENINKRRHREGLSPIVDIRDARTIIGVNVARAMKNLSPICRIEDLRWAGREAHYGRTSGQLKMGRPIHVNGAGVPPARNPVKIPEIANFKPTFIKECLKKGLTKKQAERQFVVAASHAYDQKLRRDEELRRGGKVVGNQALQTNLLAALNQIGQSATA